MKNKKNLILLMLLIAIIAISLSIINKEEVNENKVNNVIEEIKLVDPTTVSFNGCTSSYDNSIYYKKSSDGTYVAKVNLGQLNAAYAEANCQYETWNAIIPRPEMKIIVNDMIGNNNVSIQINIQNGVTTSGYEWYTFNDEYLVKSEFGRTGLVFYDINGNEIFNLSDGIKNTDNLSVIIEKNQVKYEVNCDQRHINYYNNSTAIFGILKYNKKTKKFIREETVKSIDYCSK